MVLSFRLSLSLGFRVRPGGGEIPRVTLIPFIRGLLLIPFAAMSSAMRSLIKSFVGGSKPKEGSLFPSTRDVIEMHGYFDAKQRAGPATARVCDITKARDVFISCLESYGGDIFKKKHTHTHTHTQANTNQQIKNESLPWLLSSR